MKAYVLIGLADCDEQNILDELLTYPEVEDVNIVFGEWDLVVKIKGQNTEEVATFVMEKIRKNNDVKLTSTLIVAK